MTQFIQTVISDVKTPGPRAYQQVGLAQAPGYLAAGLTASGIRAAQGTVLSPLQVIALASSAATGDKQGVSNAIANTVDGPLWAADPTLYAVRDAAPAPVGGPNGFAAGARDQWYQGTQTVNATVQKTFGLPADQPSNGPALNTVRANSTAPTMNTTTAGSNPLKAGNLVQPPTKANDTGAKSGQQAAGPFSAIRNGIRNTVKNVTSADGTKNADSTK